MAQHAFAKETHFALDEGGMSMGSPSAATGLEYQRLTRILRGSAIMRVEDIGMISGVMPEVFEAGGTPHGEVGFRAYPARLNAMSERAQSSGGPSKASHG